MQIVGGVFVGGPAGTGPAVDARRYLPTSARPET